MLPQQVSLTSLPVETTQLLIDDEGNLRSKSALAKGSISSGWLDASNWLLEAGNIVKALRDLGRFKKAVRLLQVSPDQRCPWGRAVWGGVG